LKQYYQCRGPFTGGQATGKEWWESLPISSTDHPLKGFAITILSIVPHSAEVERLFSDLGGVQGVKRCNLSVRTFETVGKLRNNYFINALLLRASQSTENMHICTPERTVGSTWI